MVAGKHGYFYGSVTDPTGAAIPSANVKLTKQDTQVTISKIAGSSGDFAFTFVPVGVYTLSIDAGGFKSYAGTGIALTAGSRSGKPLPWSWVLSPKPSVSKALPRSLTLYLRNSFRAIVSPTRGSCPCKTGTLPAS
ncbi:MAG: carboxypeptidase-like regulatory domain-containing protein [Bryobacteraceae bacterium]